MARPCLGALQLHLALWAERHHISLTWVLNPVDYVVLPGLVLAGLGAGRRELGLVAGRRPGTLAVLWTFPFLLPALAAVLDATIGHRLLSNVLQNGPMEEFLWRGALLSRLACLLDVRWAAVAGSLLFGLWHLPVYLVAGHVTGGAVVAGLAGCITLQATVGVGFAVLFLRTGSILVGSVVHTALDSFV